MELPSAGDDEFKTLVRTIHGLICTMVGEENADMIKTVKGLLAPPCLKKKKKKDKCFFQHCYPSIRESCQPIPWLDETGLDPPAPDPAIELQAIPPPVLRRASSASPTSPASPAADATLTSNCIYSVHVGMLQRFLWVSPSTHRLLPPRRRLAAFRARSPTSTTATQTSADIS